MAVEVTIDGNAYPARITMGAMLRFKNETGKEVSEIGSSISLMCTYLWCCVASSCKHDGIEFKMPLLDFADALTASDIEAWNAAMTADLAGRETVEKNGASPAS